MRGGERIGPGPTMIATRVGLLFRIARIGAALSLALTVAGMLTPVSETSEELAPDLLLHAIGFGLPALLAAFATRERRGLMTALAVIAAAALASEAAQTLVPGRTVSALDLAADAVGIAIGAALGRVAQSVLLGLARP